MHIRLSRYDALVKREKKRKRRTCFGGDVHLPNSELVAEPKQAGKPGRSHVVTKLADMVLARIHIVHCITYREDPKLLSLVPRDSNLIYILLLHTTAISLDHLLFCRGIANTQPWLSSGRNTQACWSVRIHPMHGYM